MFWNENPKPESKSTGFDDPNEPQILKERSIKDIVELSQTIAKMSDNRSKGASMMYGLLSAILNVPELYKMALKIIGKRVTDYMIDRIEKHVKDGGQRIAVRHLAVICGMPVSDPKAMEELLDRQLSSDAMSQDELMAFVESKIPPTCIADIAEKWCDPGHVRVAAIKHLEDTLALLKSDMDMTDPQLLKEMMDSDLILEAAIILSGQDEAIKMHCARLIRFKEMADEPSLAPTDSPVAS